MMNNNNGLTLDETIAEAPAYRVGWVADSEIVAIHWHGRVSKETYKDGMMQTLEGIQDSSTQKFLNHARDLKPKTSWDDGVSWVVDEWLSQFASTSVTATAVVYPDDPVGQFMTDKIGRIQTESDFESLYTETLQTAVAWLRNQ